MRCSWTIKMAQADLNLSARQDYIEADPVHFRNLISNLIDNAVKYSKGKPELKITTHSTQQEFSDPCGRQWYWYD